MTDNIKMLRQTMSSRLQVEAAQIAAQMHDDDLVLRRDALVPRKQARTQHFWGFFKEIWQAAEGLFAAGIVTGLALAIYRLLGLLLG